MWQLIGALTQRCAPIRLLIVLLLTADVFSEDYTTWSYSRAFTLNTTADGAGLEKKVYDFPLLVRLDPGTFSYFSQTLPGGADIRFAKPDGTHLPYQVEQWIDNTGDNDTAAIWVTIDTVFSDSMFHAFTMYWGKDDAVDSSQGSAVFDTAYGFSGVWHLDEDGNTKSGGYVDATSNGHHATGISLLSGSESRGIIGNAQYLDGIADAIRIPASAAGGLGKFTMSLWVKTTESGSNAAFYKNPSLFGFDITGSGTDDFEIFSDSGTLGSYCGFNGVNYSTWQSAEIINDATWHFVAAVYDGSSVKLYLDGSYISSGHDLKADGSALAAKPFDIGAQFYNDKDQYFHSGYFDEVVISKKVQGANWIKLCFENQHTNQKLVAIVEDTAKELIITEPKDTVMPVGLPVSFSVSAMGQGTLTYKWLCFPADAVTYSTEPVGTAATLTLALVIPANSGDRFRCVVSDQSGNDSSRWALLTVIDTPHIVIQPQSREVAVGESVSFSLSVQDTSMVTYSWHKIGVATEYRHIPELTFAAVSADDSGAYYCIVTNPAGTCTSDIVTLTVNTSKPLKPNASFTFTPKNGRIPLTVSFTDQSTGEITARRWDFGGNSSSTTINPQHVYTEPGYYTVWLSVTGPGGTDTMVKADSVYAFADNVDSLREIITFFNATTTVDTIDAFNGKVVFWNDTSWTTGQSFITTCTSYSIDNLPSEMVPVGAPVYFENGDVIPPLYIGFRIDSLLSEQALNDVRIYRDNAGKLYVNFDCVVDVQHRIVYVKTDDLNGTFIPLLDTKAPEITIYGDTASAVMTTTDLTNEVEICDNVTNVRWEYWLSSGDQPPMLYKQGVMGPSKTKLVLTIPDTASAISSETGLRALLVINDGCHTDTVNLSRSIMRMNSDAFISSAHQWNPIYVTAVLDQKDPVFFIDQLLTYYGVKTYDKKHMRLYRWHSSASNLTTNEKWIEYQQANKEEQALFSFEPGRLFWLKTSHNTPVYLGQGHTISLKDTLKVELPSRQWTDFGMPYCFDIRLEDVLSASGSDADSIQVYRWKCDPVTNVYVLDPWYVPGLPTMDDHSRIFTYTPQRGGEYSFYNTHSKTVTLRIPPVPATMVGVSKQSVPSKNAAWGTRIIAQSDDHTRLPTVYLGYSSTVTDRYYPLPPSFVKIGVSVLDRVTSERYGHFISGNAKDGLVKELLISNSGDSTRSLNYYLEQVGTFPEHYSVFCYDAGTMMHDSSGTITVPAGSSVSRWIVIGDAAFQRNFIATATRQEFTLDSPYPNPANACINIRYTVPFGSMERVRVAIFDILGKKVWEKKTNALLEEGVHTVSWYGRDQQGRMSGSGFYIIRLTVENSTGKVLRHFERAATLLR